MTKSKFEVSFIGNAIVDIISKITDENLHELCIPKGSMQLIDEKSSNEILKNNELILEQRTDDVLQLIVR